jgi:hypothetical protein
VDRHEFVSLYADDAFMKKIFMKYRSKFYRQVKTLGVDEQHLACCWYVCAYQAASAFPPKSRKDILEPLSFPWILQDILYSIKKAQTQ